MGTCCRLCSWLRWCSGRRLLCQAGRLDAPVGGGFLLLLLVAPLVFRAPEGPAAREARRPHFVRRRASKPARALRSLRRPPHRRCLWFWYARPDPAAAHGRRSQALLSLRRPPHRRRMWFWCARAPSPPMGAQTGSGARNIAPAWCSSSWHGASLKQKPPTHAHNRRKLAYLGVLGRIIFHGAPQQLMHGRFFFQSDPACGHRCQQLSPDRGTEVGGCMLIFPADEGGCHVGVQRSAAV